MPLRSVIKPFYFLRHGESVANSMQITCGGGVDTPLTDRGRQQATRAGEIMARVSVKPTVIVHSDLSRAKETAQRVNTFLDLPMIELETLKEHKVGALEGVHWNDSQQYFTDELDPPLGETVAEFVDRATRAVAHVLTNHEMPLIVAHWGIWASIPRIFHHRFVDSAENAIPYYFEPHLSPYQVSEIGFPWKAHVLDICGQTNISKGMWQSSVAPSPCPVKPELVLKAG